MSCPSRPASGTSAALLLLALLIAAPSAQADGVSVAPGLSVQQEYASNPSSASRGQAKPDLITRVTPSLSVDAAGDSGRARFSGGLRVRRHSEITSLNSEDPYLKLTLQRSLTDRLGVFANGDWTSLTNRDPVEDGGVVIQQGRPDLDQLSFGGGARYSLGARTLLTANYTRAASRYTTTEFSAPQRDVFSDIYLLSLNRTATPRDTLSTSLRLRNTTFDAIQTLNGRGSGTQQDRQIEATVGWARILSPTWRANLDIGVRYLTSEGVQLFPNQAGLPLLGVGFDDATTAFTGGASINREGKRSRMSLAFNQSTQPGGGRQGSLDVQTVSLSYARDLNRRLSLTLGGSYSNQSSASEGVVAAAFPGLSVDECNSLGGDPGLAAGACVFTTSETEQDTNVTRLSAGLKYRLRERLTLSLLYLYTDVDARGGFSTSFDDHRIRFGLSYFYDIDVP